MLINPLRPEWLSELNQHHAALPHGAGLMLLIDSAFIPKLFRQLSGGCQPILLFEFLPGCTNEARDVSPFVVPFDPASKSLGRLLAQCSGWPMLSALATYETAEQLAKRLAAWCIVEVNRQNFNFRFPDTRRLPAIFQTLTPQQRSEFLGSAIGWHYIGREGSWCSLPLESSTILLPIPDKSILNERQFGQLLEDSEPDEIWVQLLDRGVRTDLPPSQRHAVLSNALHVADKNGLDDVLKIGWFMDCLTQSYSSEPHTLGARLAEWKQENSRSVNETVYQSV